MSDETQDEQLEVDIKTVDWFAGCALTGLLASPNREGSAESFAKDAYAHARAMIRERAK